MALIRRRKYLENKKKIPGLSEKYMKIEQDLKSVLSQEDTSKQRFKNRIQKIHSDRYFKKWNSRNIIQRLYSTSYQVNKKKEKEKRFNSFD